MKGFSGLPGGGNMQALMKQAQKMQEDLQKVQQEAEGYSDEGSAGGGMVKVVANGKNQIVSVIIDPQVLSDVEMVQDLIVAACNEALKKVQDKFKEKIASATGGLGVPGLF